MIRQKVTMIVQRLLIKIHILIFKCLLFEKGPTFTPFNLKVFAEIK